MARSKKRYRAIVNSFLGLASYYHRFIKSFGTISAPSNTLTQNAQRFNWSSKAQDALDTLKDALTRTPVLGFPNNSDPLILNCDASSFAISGILSQVQEGTERVIAYFSKSLLIKKDTTTILLQDESPSR